MDRRSTRVGFKNISRNENTVQCDRNVYCCVIRKEAQSLIKPCNEMSRQTHLVQWYTWHYNCTRGKLKRLPAETLPEIENA